MAKKNEMYKVYVNGEFSGSSRYLKYAKKIAAEDLNLCYNYLGYDKSIDSTVLIKRSDVEYRSWDSGKRYTKYIVCKPQKAAV